MMMIAQSGLCKRRKIRLFFNTTFFFLVIYFWLWRTVSGVIKVNRAVEGEGLVVSWVPSAKPMQVNRNFASNPITAQESLLLRQQDKSGITAAVCHRTLFGDNNVHLDPLFAFVSYYRLLGFDHIFFWYRPNIANLPHFVELRNLPYVTMTEYTGGGVEHGQAIVEEQCMSNASFAASYDWTLVIDADEYLWFHTSMSIKDFLAIYHSNYTFLSFGKWMYTMQHAVKDDVQDSGFGLDSLAFTAKSHCMRYTNQQHIPRKYTWCPSYLGRSKVLAKPAHHKKVNIHGKGFRMDWAGLMHFDTSVAHLKEWRNILGKGSRKINYRLPLAFNVSSGREIDLIHAMQAHELVDGKLTMHFDYNLHNWMRFVASGCRKL